MALLSYPEADYDVLFTKPVNLDDLLWTGAGNDRLDLARQAGVETVEDLDRLGAYLAKAHSKGLAVHYLPPYQATSLLKIADVLAIDPSAVVAGASGELIEAVARQRSVKSDVEIADMEEVYSITDQMHRLAMAMTRPGAYEYEIIGAMQGFALAQNRPPAFIPVVTVRGEVLHNHSCDNLLEDGQILLNDSGLESRLGYASDITRSYPVNGRFSTSQAEVYNIVLRAQLAGIEGIRPQVDFGDLHYHAARIIADGLRQIGLMQGNSDDAAAAGAHALFFPHGLGHMLGLDVHDMEDLGDIVGYKKGTTRSPQFGTNFLRLCRSLEEGYVVTVEPGIYFIPALIDRWQQEQRHSEFINYDRLASFRSFGGIRIEDNVVVTKSGGRVLGPGIPKSVADVEEAMAAKI